MKRKLSREEVIKISYSMDLNNDFSEDALEKYLNDFSVENLDFQYIKETIKNIINNKNNINDLINKNSKDWRINRIAKVDLAILRVGISEMLYNNSIPCSVSINEAIEISKKYSNKDSHKFINGILGSIYRGLNLNE